MTTPSPSTLTSIQAASSMANNGVIFGTGECLAFVRSVLGFQTDPVSPENGVVSAAAAWHQVPAVERHTDKTPPIGVPVYWTGGSKGYGHIALSAGGGSVYSTDFSSKGYVGDGRVRLTSIAAINNADSALNYQGWSPYLGDTTASDGTYGTVYNTPGTGLTTTNGQAPSTDTTGGIASALLAPFKEIGSSIKAGGLRIGYGLAGVVLVMFALKMIGEGSA